MTVPAPLHGMIRSKLLPVAFLVWIQHPGAVAEWTHNPQCPDDCPTDKFRTVGNALNCLEQALVHLKCDNLLLPLHAPTQPL